MFLHCKLRRRGQHHRSGNVLVLSVFMMMVMLCVLAFAIDLGYLYVVRSELQKSADASALAAAWDLIDEDTLAGDTNPWLVIDESRTRASEYAAFNHTGGVSPELGESDVEIGYLANPSDPTAEMTSNDPSKFNAVRVRVRRTSAQNSQVPLFFAKLLGTAEASEQAEATAAFLNGLSGFTTPSSGENLGILPFALDQDSWNDLLAGSGTDDYSCTWDANTQDWVTSNQPDGILEINLFPQNTGSPGNRGTVDIGRNNNSTKDLARQIVDGISADDLSYHGGSLEFDANGELFLNGDTGISAGMKDELASIAGQPRIIPIFTQVSGNGNNAQYTIVDFVGICVLNVKLTGSAKSKRVIIQPAIAKSAGIIPPTEAVNKGSFVFSPVWLVR